MKYLKYTLVPALMAGMLACEEPTPELNPSVEAEIVGQDFTRWLCGGGWLVATANDTVTVQEIPDEEIMAILSSDSYIASVPLKVNVTFSDSPSGTCAIEFSDHVKEISSISLRK